MFWDKIIYCSGTLQVKHNRICTNTVIFLFPKLSLLLNYCSIYTVYVQQTNATEAVVLCVCVCVCERERERERERVCVCVRVRERERVYVCVCVRESVFACICV